MNTVCFFINVVFIKKARCTSFNFCCKWLHHSSSFLFYPKELLFIVNLLLAKYTLTWQGIISEINFRTSHNIFKRDVTTCYG